MTTNDNALTQRAGTRRARWGLLAVVVVMAVALVGTGLMTWLDHRAAADAVAQTRAHDVFRAVRRSLRDAPDPLAEVDDVLAEFSDVGLRYIALLNRRGELVAQAGETIPGAEPEPRTDLDVPFPREPRVVRVADRVRLTAQVGPPGGGGRREGRIILEMEPRMADDLAARAQTHLVVSVAAAGVLFIVGLFFWRLGRRQDAALALLQKNRRLAALGEMAAVLGHEIRNPLASLKGHAQLVLERLEPESRTRGSAERVVKEAERLELLTSQVLDFAKTGTLRREDVAPADILLSAVETVGDARVHVDAADAPATWSLDRTRMEQVLVNVLKNASEATPSDRAATIDARVSRDGTNLSFSVKDAGPGFPEGELDTAFEPFRTHRTRGTGLGLAIARRIVEAHGGTITAGNATDGGGAVVTIRIPSGARASDSGSW